MDLTTSDEDEEDEDEDDDNDLDNVVSGSVSVRKNLSSRVRCSSPAATAAAATAVTAACEYKFGKNTG